MLDDQKTQRLDRTVKTHRERVKKSIQDETRNYFNLHLCQALMTYDWTAVYFFFLIQTEKQELEEVKDPLRGPSVEKIDTSLDVSKEDKEPHEEEQSDSIGEQENLVCGEDNTPTATDVVEGEGKTEQKSGEGSEDDKGEEVEIGGAKCDGETLDGEKRQTERSKPEGQAKEGVKDGADETLEGATMNKQTKEVDVNAKDKEKSGDAGKKAKPKRKGGAPSSSVPRPRPSARSIRAAARNDIIAKFQQGAPE